MQGVAQIKVVCLDCEIQTSQCCIIDSNVVRLLNPYQQLQETSVIMVTLKQ